MKKVNFFKDFFLGVSLISTIIDIEELNKLVKEIKKIKNKKGRIFFLGVGGSAGNCSHAVNDFRKICGIESYTPLDNVSELTARINDEGWDSSLSNWLKVSNLNSKDAIFIFSVGGGDKKKNISVNLIEAVKYAKFKNARIFGVVGRKKSYLKNFGDNIIVVPLISEKLMTPYSESFQAILWHALVSHPALKSAATKW
jgi:D-sedoheptulose 7-phosphate isomerase